MLPEKNRLKKEKDFEKVFKFGRGFKQGSFYLKAVGNSLESSRFGFIVSKKFSKKAVERNRMKRMLREITRDLLSKAKDGLDVVIVVMPGAKIDPDFSRKNFEQLFKRAKITDDKKGSS